jgi:hypothetical protein
LRARRDRAAFDESESERCQTIDVRGVLVQPRGKSDAVGKFEPHRRNRGRGHARGRQLCDSAGHRGIERRESDVVRSLGVEREQQRSKQRIEHRREACSKRQTRVQSRRRADDNIRRA